MSKQNNGIWKPGVIYELGVWDDLIWIPFYVGETTQADVRLAAHKTCARSGKELLVYDYIRTLTEQGIQTCMEIVDSYGTEGPLDLEDEHIMKLLLQDYKLQNMKKGSNAWMTNMIKIRDKMNEHNFKSLRKFKEWDAEQTRIKNDARHQKRIAEGKELSWHDKLLLSIKQSDKFKDEAALKQMRQETAERKAADVFKNIKR